jgi:protein phosphatase
MPREVDQVELVARSAARSDVGKVRDNNEDRVGLWARKGVVLALVADGMGGAAAGEEASRLTVEAIQADFLGEARGSETLRELSEEEIADKMRNAIRRANYAVIQHAANNPELQGMGTTITLAFVRDNRVVIAHVGDSRAYLVAGRKGWINQITDDHSFVEALVVSGHITAEQAAAHPMRNVLYRALGQVDDTEADIYKRDLSEGDRLILCSDGLTRHVTQTEINNIASRSEEPEEIVEMLIALANERGGEDNISAVAIVMEQADTLELGDPPDPIVYQDTDIGLYQAPEPEDPDEMDRSTREIPSVKPQNRQPPNTGDTPSDEQNNEDATTRELPIVKPSDKPDESDPTS